MSSVLLQLWDTTLPGHLDLGRRLLAAWDEPGRVYHDQTHLHSCLTAWASLGGQSRSEALALWFHDLIHHNQPGTDEQASAAAAAAELGAIDLPQHEISEVTRLILATIVHRPAADDQACGRVCDADLAILGAEPARYRASVAALRAEFTALSASQWHVLRHRQVAALRARESLFATAIGLRLWEAAAQQNLRQEWEELNSQSSNGAGSPAP